MPHSQEGHRTIAPGDILVAESTPLPASLHLESNSAVCGWALFADRLDAYQVEYKLAAAGWTSFFKAVTVTATAFGFERRKMIRGALKRLTADADRQCCNCLEIDDIATSSFLGVAYVSISAHPRHIQKVPIEGIP
ncbi:MAG TPA: hypothetical protein VGP79_11515 [Bryobacteraceae bacterium]|jgi:hypothetical protein|nr:hypothetical protein [Bryobacteraceae bacterium]